MDSEMWKKIIVYNTPYMISNRGNIKSMSGKILKQRLNADGYPVATLGSNTSCRSPVRIHVLVARAFIPKPNNHDKFEVNHKNFDRKNNNVENLEWVTHQENIKYSYQYNSKAQYIARDGIKNGRATFNDKEILEIRRLYNKENISIAEIALRFNSKSSTIGNIVHNQTWKHLL